MFMARRNRRALVGVVAVAALAVAGCSSKAKTAAAPTTSAASSTAAAAASSAPVAATSAAATTAASSAPASSPAAGGAPQTITIGLFGTFGFKEAGLYDAYMKLHPNITIIIMEIYNQASATSIFYNCNINPKDKA